MIVERLDLALLERPMVARRPVRKDADQNTPDFCIRRMSIPDASERGASHGPKCEIRNFRLADQFPI